MILGREEYMKKEKNSNLIDLTRLYLGFLFQKATIIIFSISLLLIFLIILYISNIDLDMNVYLQSYTDIHLTYFTQSFFIIQLFNSIIIATITISLTINSTTFDTLFISHTSRIRICVSKILATSLVLFLLSLYEILIIMVIPLIRYPMFKITSSMYLSIIFLFLSTVVETILSFLISTALPYIFIPMIYMFISIVIKLLANNHTDFKDVIGKVIPMVSISYKNIYCDAIGLAPVWIVLFMLLYISIYCIKDIK